jgi:hypothetical protein
VSSVVSNILHVEACLAESFGGAARGEHLCDEGGI